MSLSTEYRIRVTQDDACQVGKHYSPFRCKSVPDDRFRLIFMQYPKLCEFVLWDCHVNWMKDTRIFSPSAIRQAARKKWMLHPLSIKLQGILQRQLNYERSTFLTGHVLCRAGRIYRNMMGYSWHWEDPFGPRRRIVFTKNDVEVDSIKDR